MLQLIDEFLVLGSQPLTVLHDHLHCLAGAHLHAVGADGSGAAYLYAEVCVCMCACVGVGVDVGVSCGCGCVYFKARAPERSVFCANFTTK